MVSPDLAAIFRDLAANDVRYVLTGSLAAAAHGAPFSVRDVDVTPALDVDNLHRVARFLAKTDARPHGAAGDSWHPYPVAVRNLDHLFETTHGLVDIVPTLAGAYRDLQRRAVPMEAFGETILVARLDDVLVAVRSKKRKKNATRDEAYAVLERGGATRPTEGDGTRFLPITPVPPPVLPDGALAAAGRIVTERTGHPTRLRRRESVVSEAGYRNRLVRCDVEGGGDTPNTLLVKRTNLDTGELLREWAGFELLGRLPAAAPFHPRFFGGDHEHRFVLLEDLGDVRDRDLASFLVTSGPDDATEFLIGYAEAAGGLQAATFGTAAEYATIAASLGAPASRNHAADRLSETLRSLLRTFETAGVSVEEGANRDAEAAARDLETPGPFRAYSRGDVCTKNVVRVDGAVRIFDLEYGGFRHALVDGAFFGLRHLHCLYAGRFPENVRRRAEDAYRAALARGCPAAGDDGEWARGFAAASAGWLSAILEPLPEVLEEDRQRGSATVRQRIVTALEEFTGNTDRAAQLPALTDAAARLRERLESRWDVPPLFVYPAFDQVD